MCNFHKTQAEKADIIKIPLADEETEAQRGYLIFPPVTQVAKAEQALSHHSPNQWMRRAKCCTASPGAHLYCGPRNVERQKKHRVPKYPWWGLPRFWSFPLKKGRRDPRKKPDTQVVPDATSDLRVRRVGISVARGAYTSLWHWEGRPPCQRQECGMDIS